MKRTIKQIAETLFFPLLATALLLVVGCSSKGGSSKTSSAPETTSAAATTAVTTAATTTSTTTTTAPLMSPMSSPTQYLEGFPTKGDISFFFNGPDNTLLIQCEKSGEKECVVYSPIEDKIVRTTKLSNESEILIGAFSDGTIATISCMDKTTIYLYPPYSNKPQVLDLGDADVSGARVDMKNDCVYYADFTDDYIGKIDRKGNISSCFSDLDVSMLCDLDVDSGFFKASECSETAESGEEPALFSVETGERISTLSSCGWSSALTEGYCVDAIVNVDYETNERVNKMDAYALTDGKYRKTYALPYDGEGTMYLSGNPFSKYLAAFWMDGAMDGTTFSVDFIDVENGLIAKDQVKFDESASWYNACYCENIGRWFVALSVFDEDSNFGSKLMMIDPSLLKFDVKLEEDKEGRVEYEPAKVGEGFKNVRKKADEIEKKYGVRILVGNEVKNAEANSAYTFVSTEGSDYPYMDEIDIQRLEALEDILSTYPKDFFKRFKSKKGKCGLRISLVDSLENKIYSTFSAAGVAYVTGGWYDIGFDGDFIYDAGMLHHEIWHVVEDLVEKTYHLDENAWSALNPYGFSYSRDFDGYEDTVGTNYDTYQYVSAAYEKGSIPYEVPYFISDYSRVTPMEDRATIVQEMFAPTYDLETFDDTGLLGAKGLSEYPHIKAKLDFMAEWSKKLFGYVYWEEVLENSEKQR